MSLFKKHRSIILGGGSLENGEWNVPNMKEGTEKGENQ